MKENVNKNLTEKITAIVLAAGRGLRMRCNVLKPYLNLGDRPLITYALKAFQDSEVDEVIVVAGKEELDYFRREIVEPYGFSKVSQIVPGGCERYESVYLGLCSAIRQDHPGDYVLIHDGARPFISPAKISACIRTVRETKACVMGMPVDDTIKIVDENNCAVFTPDRRTVWRIQTPQCFLLEEIHQAYSKMMEEGETRMTDDAMVMESYGRRRVKVIHGGYDNIKITKPEDLIMGEAMLRQGTVKIQ
ncbi:MAG: 2-C-methyl-D-erythritol 4-phosphate cytidylyltransferase [Eubacterium sp.]|nr:2-C-methyl-D-erythritol 4-phosphate cytidylyltransferase [Eubacterium sp.]